MSKRVSTDEILRARETFLRYVKPGSTVYTILEHCSRSGRSRSIRVLVPIGDGEFIHPNHAAALLTGHTRRRGREGVTVGGCGMDMGFHLIYSLSARLYPDGFGCIGEGCPSSEHGNGDRDYTPHDCQEADDGEGHWHADGGYALRHRWL